MTLPTALFRVLTDDSHLPKTFGLVSESRHLESAVLEKGQFTGASRGSKEFWRLFFVAKSDLEPLVLFFNKNLSCLSSHPLPVSVTLGRKHGGKVYDNF